MGEKMLTLLSKYSQIKIITVDLIIVTRLMQQTTKITGVPDLLLFGLNLY